jgi:hypothetical protein
VILLLFIRLKSRFGILIAEYVCRTRLMHRIQVMVMIVRVMKMPIILERFEIAHKGMLF